MKLPDLAPNSKWGVGRRAVPCSRSTPAEMHVRIKVRIRSPAFRTSITCQAHLWPKIELPAAVNETLSQSTMHVTFSGDKAILPWRALSLSGTGTHHEILAKLRRDPLSHSYCSRIFPPQAGTAYTVQPYHANREMMSLSEVLNFSERDCRILDRLECMLVQGASFSRHGSSRTDFSEETGKELQS